MILPILFCASVTFLFFISWFSFINLFFYSILLCFDWGFYCWSQFSPDGCCGSFDALSGCLCWSLSVMCLWRFWYLSYWRYEDPGWPSWTLLVVRAILWIFRLLPWCWFWPPWAEDLITWPWVIWVLLRCWAEFFIFWFWAPELFVRWFPYFWGELYWFIALEGKFLYDLPFFSYFGTILPIFA